MHIAVHVKMDMKEQTVKQVTILKSFAFEKSEHDLRGPRLRFPPIYILFSSMIFRLKVNSGSAGMGAGVVDWDFI